MKANCSFLYTVTSPNDEFRPCEGMTQDERLPGPEAILKVPKREIFDRSDFPEFYTIKSSWVGDLLVKILTYYFNF
jgi:hypothetical protein